MTARGGNGCCSFNLAKLDPSTGAILGKWLIKGDGSLKKPSCCALEPIRGTNNVLTHTTRDAGGGYTTAATLNSVSSSGVVNWHLNGSSSQPFNTVAPSSRGAFGAYGGSIVAVAANNTLIGIDYSGGIAWTATGVGSGLRAGYVRSLYVTAAGVVAPGVSTISSPTGVVALYDASSGVAIGQSLSYFDPFYSQDSSGPYAADPATGNTLTVNMAPTVAGMGSKLEPSLSAPTTFSVPPLSYEVSGVIAMSPSYCRVLGSLILRSSAGSSDKLSSASGSTFTSLWTGMGPFTGGNVCELDSTGSYFGTRATSLGGGLFANVYKRDNTTGGILWSQDVAFNGKPSLSPCQAICIADDGYLYVGGNPT